MIERRKVDGNEDAKKHKPETRCDIDRQPSVRQCLVHHLPVVST